jgi:F-type H+-transporting ATPase subunit epsilon
MPRMEVHVVTPEREVWTGEARLVVARGTEGDVGILAGHAPLLIQLAIGPIFIQTEGERVAAAIDGGFLHVMSSGDESRVDVLAEHAELENEIDVEKERQRLEAAQQRIRSGEDEDAAAEAAKAETRLNLRG